MIPCTALALDHHEVVKDELSVLIDRSSVLFSPARWCKDSLLPLCGHEPLHTIWISALLRVSLEILGRHPPRLLTIRDSAHPILVI